MAWRQTNENASVKERAIAVVCYLTAGLAGIIYIIISRSSGQSRFFRFHFLQSIVLGILSLMLAWCRDALMLIAAGPFTAFFNYLNTIMPNTGGMIANGILMVIGWVFTAFALLPFYALIFAALGKYSEIPYISDVVRRQM